MEWEEECKSVGICGDGVEEVLFGEFLMIGIVSGVRWYVIVVLIWICVMGSDDEDFLMCFLGG